MNKRQKKKFDKKGEMKKFTINFNARIAEYNYAASVDIKNGKLKNWSIIKINITSLLGQTSQDGNTDARLEILLNELKYRTNTILFID